MPRMRSNYTHFKTFIVYILRATTRSVCAVVAVDGVSLRLFVAAGPTLHMTHTQTVTSARAAIGWPVRPYTPAPTNTCIYIYIGFSDDAENRATSLQTHWCALSLESTRPRCLVARTHTHKHVAVADRVSHNTHTRIPSICEHPPVRARLHAHTAARTERKRREHARSRARAHATESPLLSANSPAGASIGYDCTYACMRVYVCNMQNLPMRFFIRIMLSRFFVSAIRICAMQSDNGCIC